MLPLFVTKALLKAVITASVAVPDMFPKEAVMMAVPPLTAVASPVEPVIVATPALSELHVTNVVTSCVAPFDKVPFALNC